MAGRVFGGMSGVYQALKKPSVTIARIYSARTIVRGIGTTADERVAPYIGGGYPTQHINAYPRRNKLIVVNHRTGRPTL
jgi:hypothetical protein